MNMDRNEGRTQKQRERKQNSPVSGAKKPFSMFSNKSFGTLDWDYSSGEVVLNGLLWKVLGFSRTQSEIPITQKDFFDRVFVVDRIKFEAIIRRLAKSNHQDTCTLQMRKADGKSCWIDFQLNSVGVLNKAYKHIVGTAYDVSKIKYSEKIANLAVARYERILQASTDGLWEWSAKDNEFHFSQSCWENIGYSKDDDVIKFNKDDMQLWREHVHPEDLSRFDANLAECIAQKKILDMDYRMRDKFGDWRWIRGRGKMTYDSRDEIAYVSGCNVDISEQKALEKKLQDERYQADLANTKKSEFLSNMSHELRTPLNSIIGFTQLFQMDSNLTQEQLDNVNEINSAGDHLLALIDDVLDLAKIEAGGASIDMRAVKPYEIIKECLTLVRPQADMKSVLLNFRANSFQHETVELDKMRFKQVMLNLLSNAIKYNLRMGRVDISIEKFENQLCISVSDNGIGIPESMHHKVFSPFNRLGAEQSDISGTGIGLALTKELTEKMNGKIAFSSKPEQGSVFWVEFPLENKSLNMVQDTHAVAIANDKNYSKENTHNSKMDKTLRKINEKQGIIEPIKQSGDVSNVFDDLARNSKKVSSTYKSLHNNDSSNMVVSEKVDSNFYEQDKDSKLSNHTKKVPKLKLKTEKKILYIEENPANRRLFEQALSRQKNIHLTQAKDALRGLYELRTQQFDVVILDTHLSGMNAYEILEVLHADTKFERLKKIAVSSDASPLEKKRGIDAGFDGFLAKPIDLYELVLLLGKLLS